MGQKARKRWFTALRIVICALALWFVVRGVTLSDRVVLAGGDPVLVGRVHLQEDHVLVTIADGSTRRLSLEAVARDEEDRLRISYGLKTAFRESSKTLLLLAVIVTLPVGIFQGIRLQWLLRAQSIRLPYWDCIKLSYAGNFLNFAAPLGSTAGDVFKAYFLSLHTERKTEAVTTIFLDRAIGLATLLALVGLMVGISGDESRLGPFKFYVLSSLALGAAAGAAYLSPALRRRLLPRSWIMRLPMFDQLQRIDNTARVLASRKTILAGALLMTMVLQVLSILGYFCVALALGFTAATSHILEFWTYFYTGCVVQSLPGPPQGLGTVELAYRYFFQPYGGPSQIVSMALGIRVVVLTCALPGVLVTLTGSYKPREEAEVQEKEPAERSKETPAEPRCKATAS